MTEDQIKGRFAAIELMIGQLFVDLLESNENPQAWLAQNIEHNRKMLDRRVAEGTMTPEMANDALDSIQKAMQTASRHFETQGVGSAIS